jgi:hypothetical protein
MAIYNYDYVYDKTKQPIPNLDYIVDLINNSTMSDKNFGYCNWNEYEQQNGFGILELFFLNELSVEDKQILDTIILDTILEGFSKIDPSFYDENNNYTEDWFCQILFTVKRITFEDETRTKVINIAILQE